AASNRWRITATPPRVRAITTGVGFYVTRATGRLGLRRTSRIPVVRRGGLAGCATCTAGEMWVNLTAGLQFCLRRAAGFTLSSFAERRRRGLAPLAHHPDRAARRRPRSPHVR